jgi:hypothetical protein
MSVILTVMPALVAGIQVFLVAEEKRGWPEQVRQ